MYSQVPAAVMNVVEEMSLKDKRNVNMFYLLFCSSCYQLICVFALFWTDILPKFGYTDNIHEFGEKYAKYTNQTACYRRCLSLSSAINMASHVSLVGVAVPTYLG